MSTASEPPADSGAVRCVDPEATRAAGVALAAYLRAGDVLVLTGDLGAGKTTLTQGIGAGLGVRGPVTSPTFVIARVHPNERPAGGSALVHVDAYRLGSALEFDDLDLDTDLAAAVVVVEWGEGLAEGLSGVRLHVHLHAHDDGSRSVRLVGVGARWSADAVAAGQAAIRAPAAG